MFHETYKYKVQKVRLDSTKIRHPQLFADIIMSNFVCEEDSPSTLLLVYYAGHGVPGPRPGILELTG